MESTSASFNCRFIFLYLYEPFVLRFDTLRKVVNNYYDYEYIVYSIFISAEFGELQEYWKIFTTFTHLIYIYGFSLRNFVLWFVQFYKIHRNRIIWFLVLISEFHKFSISYLHIIFSFFNVILIDLDMKGLGD